MYRSVFKYVVIIGFIGLLGFLLGMTTYIKQETINGVNLYYYDYNAFLQNISLSFNGFRNNISNFYNVNLQWDSVINSIKSIGNILIATLNTTLLPFSIIGNVFVLIMGICGLPMNTTNFLYNIFANINSLQVPYIPY